MKTLLELSALSLSFLSLWAFFLCLIGIFSVVLSVTQKRYRVVFFSLIPFICNYLLWQILFDIHLSDGTKGVAALSRRLGGLPWMLCFIFLCLLTAISLYLLISVMRYEKNSVTPTAVKHCLDQMPCGVCCWQDNGRVLFSNICMNRLCLAITHDPLLNGNQFCDAAGIGIRKVGDKRWRFTRRDIVVAGEHLHEMIASDITTEYIKTQALENDKAELFQMNRKLREYTLCIDDTVRRQEILQAKVNIHDEMNRLMLSTMAAESGNSAVPDQIFSLWEKNALLLCMEANENGNIRRSGIEKLADALKIRLIWQSELPACLSEQQQNLFYSAAREAIANAAKHAHAETMEIFFEESDLFCLCSFTNDGQIRTGEVQFTGGLANLSVLAKRQDAYVSAIISEKFTLSLRFPKKSNIHQSADARQVFI